MVTRKVRKKLKKRIPVCQLSNMSVLAMCRSGQSIKEVEEKGKGLKWFDGQCH